MFTTNIVLTIQLCNVLNFEKYFLALIQMLLPALRLMLIVSLT